MSEKIDNALEKVSAEAELELYQTAKEALKVLKLALEAKSAVDSQHPANIQGEKVVTTAIEILKIAFSK